MNILYYEVDKDANRSGLELGPFLITPTQTVITTSCLVRFRTTLQLVL